MPKLRARRTLLAALLLFVGCGRSCGNDEDPMASLKLRDWRPKTTATLRRTPIDKPAFEVIDFHTHLRNIKEPARLVAKMDRIGIKMIVDLDGGVTSLKANLARYDRAFPGRFASFAVIDFENNIDAADWSDRTARALDDAFRQGARGLKIHKSLGLYIRYKSGKLMPVDDPKLDAAWRICAKHRRPVVIHTADPAAFFEPFDKHNERWHELLEEPDWIYSGKKLYSREQLFAQRNRLLERHPDTTFVAAHLSDNAEDLPTLAKWLDRFPNLYVDLSARLNELGRQPYSARRFLLKYQDRLLFGTDFLAFDKDRYRVYFRVLETADEYIDTRLANGIQGIWRTHGFYLPKAVLKKIYRDNALKLLGDDQSPHPATSQPTQR